ncbi:MAG TPA: outer membrane beta-barrel family protein, partial [Puia sp.]|nr:outer membrane beta-barrel family protein [Puia sp.]
LTGLITYTPLTRHIKQSFSPFLMNGDHTLIDVPAPYEVNNSADIDILVGQADFTRRFAHSWNLESGVKYQRTVTNSHVVQQTESNGSYLIDSNYSFNDKLTEAITAGYAIVSKKYKKDLLQAGLRVENTNATSPGNFSEKYTDLFPNVSWQHTLAQKLNFSLGYKRQINRPPYQEMLPYSIVLDEYTILQGNPLLRPSYSQVATINLNAGKFNVSLNYNYTTGAFGKLPIKEDTNTQATYYATQNIDNTAYWTLNVFYPLKITSWWTANTSAHGGYASSTGTVLGVRETRSSFNANLSSYQEFSISRIFRAEAGYYWYSKQTTNLITTNAYGNINAGISAKVLKGKGSIGLDVYELLKRTTYRSFQQFGSFESTTASQSDSRRIYLSFTLNFGKIKANLAEKKLGNEDAIKRAR